MGNIKTVEVEECYNCSAPDPHGVQQVETSGTRRGETFMWCRTCWETGCVRVTLYPNQFPNTYAAQVACNIEQTRRLKVGWYDEPDRHTRLKAEIMNDLVEFLERHPKKARLDSVEMRGYDYAVNLTIEAVRNLE
jgi:hypothetical protein